MLNAEQGCMAGFVKASSGPKSTYAVWYLLLAILASITCFGQSLPSDPVCPRPAAGANVLNPPELRSRNGKLEVTFHFKYQQTRVSDGPPRYCYITGDGV